MDMDPRTEDQLRLLCESRNREILTVLDESDRSIRVREVAEQLVERELSLATAATVEDRVERVRRRLHHERLPKLADAGLLAYDPETRQVERTAQATPLLDAADGERFEALLERLPDGLAGDGHDVGVLEGREAVIEYGRQLADEAEEELFCMYVSTDLLEEECLRRAEDAIDRGVEMSLGSANEAVRALTRENLPEATIWEPQLDWLNTPSYPRVGRLVVIDRRKVMFAILEEPPSTGSPPEETALVGEGEDNPLVVLVRELLGRRLDHLDLQSDSFLGELQSSR